MSKELTFYRDKTEKFKCNLHIDGASYLKSFVRLCLETSGGTNYFFKGKISENGECIINIPALTNITQEEGKATVEVIAENNYFSVYETSVKIKNSVTVKFTPEVKEEEDIDEDLTPKISFSLIEDKKKAKKPKKKDEDEDDVDLLSEEPEEEVEESEEEVEESVIKKLIDW